MKFKVKCSMKIVYVIIIMVLTQTTFASAGDCPIIFLHGHHSEATDIVGWETWKSDEYESAMERIIAQQYGGYSDGSPLNCNKYSTLPSTNGETRKIYNFSYYRSDGERGVIGSNGNLECLWVRSIYGTLCRKDSIPQTTWFKGYDAGGLGFIPPVFGDSWAENLANFIEKVLVACYGLNWQSNPNAKVDVVAHSMGGLVARAAIRWYTLPFGDSVKTRIRKLLMVGTPNHPYDHSWGEWIYELFTSDPDWQRVGEDWEMDVESENAEEAVSFSDNVTSEERKWCDHLGYLNYGVQTATIAGNRGRGLLPENDYVVFVQQVKTGYATFEPTIYASHSYSHAGGRPEYSLVTCTYTEEFVKNWIIDDNTTHNGTASDHENCAPFPNPWYFWEVRFFAPIVDYSHALSMTVNLIDVLGDTIGSGAYAIYKYTKSAPGTPVWAINPGPLASGVYFFYYRVYDMDGLVIECPSSSNLNTEGWDSTAQVTLLSPNGSESYEYGDLPQIKWTHEFWDAINQKLYLTDNNGASWMQIGVAVGSDSIYEWYVPPGINSNQCRIKVIPYLDTVTTLQDMSNNAFTIVGPKITAFYPQSTIFDATTDSVKLNFTLEGMPAHLTMTAAGKNIFENQYFGLGEHSVYWDGRDSIGNVAIPDTYAIYIYCDTFLLAETLVTIKGTQVSGLLSSNEHWTLAGEPYVLTEDVIVNQSLTIDPSIKVMPVGNYNLSINQGRIIAIGTTNNDILFTPYRKLLPVPDSVSSGFWKGIHFAGTTEEDTIILKHCLLEAAGSVVASVDIASDTGVVNIDSCKISKSNKYGVWLNDKRKCNLSITNSIFEEDSIPARCLFTGTFGFGEGNEYLNNTINKIAVYPADLRYDMTIIPQTIPYWFRKTTTNKEFKVYVDSDSSYTPTLTIEPGTWVEFSDSTILRIGKPTYWDPYLYRWFHFRGRLICEGIETDTIRLTMPDFDTRCSILDTGNSRLDTGNSRLNVEKNSGQKDRDNPLYWRGLRFEGLEADTSKIKYTSIENAGLDTAAIIFADVININITDTKIFKSKNYGIWMAEPKPEDNFIISNCLFEEDSVPIRTSFNNLNGIHPCSFLNNQVNAIEVINEHVRKDLTVHYQPVPYHFLKGEHWFWGKRFTFADDDNCWTLTVKPGAQILFGDSTALWIGKWTLTWPGGYTELRGRIIAQGKEDSIIVFSALDTTMYWRGIRIYTSDTSRFKYCEISYGGQDFPGSEDNCQGNIASWGDKFYIVENCNILRSYSYGCGCLPPYGGSGSLVRNCYFYGNDSFPLVIRADYLDQSIDNTFVDNTPNSIAITGSITHSFTMQNQGVPYVIMVDNFDINGEGEVACLEIEDGNVLKFNGKTGYVGPNAVLKAKGVMFTAYDDDGNWWGMKFDNSISDTSVLDSCIIEKTKYYGGFWPRAAIEIINSYLKINNSYIVSNEKGIELTSPSGEVWLSGNLIAQNNCGISTWTWPATSMHIQNNDFVGNKIAACVPMGSNTIVADSNWWGDPSGPWDPSTGDPDYNPAGKGDSIGDKVIYRPWLTEPIHPSVVTLIQPNGGESLYCETDYEIKWTRNLKGNSGQLRVDYPSPLPSPTRGEGIQILRQELYYTTDFPEGGGGIKGEFFWIFIDTVAVSETSYVWQVPSDPSDRCRVAIVLYYETGRWGDKETWRQGETETGRQGKKEKLQMTNFKPQTISNFQNPNSKTAGNEIASPLARNDNPSPYPSPTRGEGNKGQEIVEFQNEKKVVENNLFDDYDGTGTIMIAVDISDANFTIPPPQYALTVYTVGQGTVIQNPDLPTYTVGTVCTLTAVPEPSYAFDHWSDSLSGTNNPETIFMNSDKIVTAHFTQPGYVLNLDSFPMYEADSLQMCGPAVAQMALNYMFWNNIIDSAGPPMLPEFAQDLLYTYGLGYSEADPFFDLRGMWYTIQYKKPMPYSEYGYNFTKRHSADQYKMLKFICQWIDYTVGTYGGHKDGHPYHVPSIVPAYGDYTNWMAIRGIHTDVAAYPMPDTLIVYGFWVNDPFPGGIGENSYKTAQEFVETYYDTLSIGDYHGEYVAVLEPPESVEGCELIIAQSIPRFNKQQINARKGAVPGQDVIPDDLRTWIIQAAIDGVTEELIPYDKNFETVFKTTIPGKPMLVTNIGEDNYYIVPFNLRRPIPKVIEKDKNISNTRIKADNKSITETEVTTKSQTMSTTEPVASDKTQVEINSKDRNVLVEILKNTVVVVLIHAQNGSFKEASWTSTPVKYLPISKEEAQQIAFDTAEEMGLEIDNINDLQPELIYRQSTPYYPEWRVVIGEYAIYISQDGSVSVEEWVQGEQESGGVMSEQGTTPFAYLLKTAAPTSFVDNTTIYYSIAKFGNVCLNIYDISGRLIKTLVDEKKDAGMYSARWDGYDNDNQKVANGVYFTRLTSGNFTSIKKVILVR